MMVRGRRSGKKSSGKRVGGRTGGTASGKESEAMVEIKEDFPVRRSPTTATRTPEGAAIEERNGGDRIGRFLVRNRDCSSKLEVHCLRSLNQNSIILHDHEEEAVKLIGVLKCRTFIMYFTSSRALF